jgi:hypothetical protein
MFLTPGASRPGPRPREAVASGRGVPAGDGVLRTLRRRLDDKRAEEARPIPRDPPDRLREAKRRLEEEHRTECEANAVRSGPRGVPRDASIC